MTCTIDGCDRAASAKGFCAMHYTRIKRHGSPDVTHRDMTMRAPQGLTDAERFWHKVEVVETGCWLWRGFLFHGYGRYSLGGQVNDYELAHRASYEAFVGPIPEGLTIDHLCRVRACVNPEHLEPVTAAENNRRGLAAKAFCSNGHPYDDEHVMIERSTGRRRCIVCTRETKRRWKAKQQVA